MIDKCVQIAMLFAEDVFVPLAYNIFQAFF